jgi:hypothetical protein
MGAKFWWRFITPPTRAQTERFFEKQVPMFSRYTRYLTGSDGTQIVDTFIVEHNDGSTSLEFQFNGIPGKRGDLFCFPGYYPGDTDERNQPLYNVCDSRGHFYGQIVSFVLQHARKEFGSNFEWTTSEEKAKSYHTETTRR